MWLFIAIWGMGVYIVVSTCTVEMCSVQPHGIREVEFIASSSTWLLAYSSSQPSLPSRSSVQLLAPTPVTQRAACRPPVFHLLIQLNFLHSSAFLVWIWWIFLILCSCSFRASFVPAYMYHLVFRWLNLESFQLWNLPCIFGDGM